MKTDRKFTEEQLQLSWCRIKQGSKIDSVSGKEITVYSPGTWNLEAGPDFLNAKIAIDGKDTTGKIEIHKKSSDWIHHGHSSDPRYADIVLHVVAEDDSTRNNRDSLPNVPVLILTPKTNNRIAPADRIPKGKCQKFFSSQEDDVLYKFFRKGGMNRFNSKVTFILENMYEKGADRTFTEQLFDACGYKQNRNNFRELYSRICRYEDLDCSETEAVIWGESGLLPDPATIKLDKKMAGFTKRLWGIWWQIRKDPLPDIKWNRSGLRPMNFPERRIAAVSMLMKKMGKTSIDAFCESRKKSFGFPDLCQENSQST